MVDAIRDPGRGKAHIDSGRRRLNLRGPGTPVTLCGRVLSVFEVVPLETTDPGDRCKQCARRKAVKDRG